MGAHDAVESARTENNSMIHSIALSDKVYKCVFRSYWMKKAAELVKAGDRIKLAGEALSVVSIELSDIGKQGQKKCRIEAKKDNGEKIVLVRPSDYPIECV